MRDGCGVLPGAWGVSTEQLSEAGATLASTYLAHHILGVVVCSSIASADYPSQIMDSIFGAPQPWCFLSYLPTPESRKHLP
jgi:hypothetical protein